MLNYKFLVFSFFIITSLIANDGFDDEDEFGESDEISIINTTQEKATDFTFYGGITASSEYSYENKHKISSTKLSTNLKFEYVVDKLHKIKSTIKAYKASNTNINNDRDFDINELTVEGTFHNGIDAKVGRQIVVWGKSDNIRITDILNPTDNTTPGMVDIKDLRLGRVMTKLDYYINKWSFSTILLHENRFSMMPKLRSDYYLGEATKTPSDSIANSSIALSANGNFEGQDIAFYLANQYVDNKTYKSNMLGLAYNKVINSFLLKTEMAYFDNYDSATVKSKIDSLVGVEYSGISDGSVSFEIANKNDDMQYALRYTQSFINQTLDFNILYSGFGKELEDGGFVRGWIDYDYNDEIALNFGVINYLGGDVAMFEKIKDNDRVFASLTYSF